MTLKQHAIKYRRQHPVLAGLAQEQFDLHGIPYNVREAKVRVMWRWWGNLGPWIWVFGQTIIVARGYKWPLDNPIVFSTWCHELHHCYWNRDRGVLLRLRNFLAGLWRSRRIHNVNYMHSEFPIEVAAIEFQDQIREQMTDADEERIAALLGPLTDGGGR